MLLLTLNISKEKAAITVWKQAKELAAVSKIQWNNKKTHKTRTSRIPKTHRHII